MLQSMSSTWPLPTVPTLRLQTVSLSALKSRPTQFSLFAPLLHGRARMIQVTDGALLHSVSLQSIKLKSCDSVPASHVFQ